MSADLAVIVVAHNDALWLPRCMASVFEHAGPIDVQVVLVDNESTDGGAELVEQQFPAVHVVRADNHGFAFGNNEGLFASRSRHVLFLNPDTEIAAGLLSNLVALMDRRPELGVVGARQVGSDGRLQPTIRRAPSPLRALGEALASERWALGSPHLGERVLDPAAYEAETECEWVSGSFMLARREAVVAAGLFDERFFLYSEETDLCLRVREAGWRVAYVPELCLVHHDRERRGSPRMEAQAAISRRLYARKRFGPVRRAGYLAAIALRYALRSLPVGPAGRRAAARSGLRALFGLDGPPFEPVPPTPVRPRAASRRTGSATS